MAIAVPEAWSLDRIREVVEALERGKNPESLGLTHRHVNYHLQAARILGWIERSGRSHTVTALGQRMLSTKSKSSDERRVFRHSIESSQLVSDVLPKLLSGMDRETITNKLMTHPETKLAKKTAEKRAGYLMRWVDRTLTDNA